MNIMKVSALVRRALLASGLLWGVVEPAALAEKNPVYVALRAARPQGPEEVRQKGTPLAGGADPNATAAFAPVDLTIKLPRKPKRVVLNAFHDVLSRD